MYEEKQQNPKEYQINYCEANKRLWFLIKQYNNSFFYDFMDLIIDPVPLFNTRDTF